MKNMYILILFLSLLNGINAQQSNNKLNSEQQKYVDQIAQHKAAYKGDELYATILSARSDFPNTYEFIVEEYLYIQNTNLGDRALIRCLKSGVTDCPDSTVIAIELSKVLLKKAEVKNEVEFAPEYYTEINTLLYEALNKPSNKYIIKALLVEVHVKLVALYLRENDENYFTDLKDNTSKALGICNELLNLPNNSTLFNAEFLINLKQTKVQLEELTNQLNGK